MGPQCARSNSRLFLLWIYRDTDTRRMASWEVSTYLFVRCSMECFFDIAIEIEKMIRDKVPKEIRSQEKIKNWIKDNL